MNDLQVASKIIPSALALQKDAYFSTELLYFQRFSVIATDIFYVCFLHCIVIDSVVFTMIFS